MLKYIDNSKGFKYTPKGQSDSDEAKFSVLLKPISVEDLADINDMLMTRTSTEVRTNYGLYYLQACRKSIIGWDNIIDIDGNQVPMTKTSYGTIDNLSLNKIPYDMIEDIGSIAIIASMDPSTIEKLS